MTPERRIKLTIMQRMQLVLTTDAVSHNEFSDTSRYLDFAKMEPNVYIVASLLLIKVG